jgi:hypothetical protein
MKNITLLSLALVLCFALTTEALETSRISEPISAENDSIAQSMTIIRERDFVTAYRNITKPESSVVDASYLDVPVNDDCDFAQAISEVQRLAFTTQEATIDGGIFSTYPNVWFLYTASATERVRAAINDTSITTNGYIAVYDGSACPEDVDIPQPIAQAGGETIGEAVPITDALPVAYSGSLAGMNQDFGECSCMMANYGFGDAVYSYTATADDSLNLLLTSTTMAPILVILDSNGDELACNRYFDYLDDEDRRGTGIFNFQVQDGETYYLVVTGRLSIPGDPNYILTILHSDYVTLDRSFSFCAYAYIDFDAIAGHQYLIEAGYMVPTTPTTFLSVQPAPVPPANDDCENATDGGVLRPNNPIQITGNNIGATRQCNELDELPEVWIEFMTEDTLNVTLDYCGIATINHFLSFYPYLVNVCPCYPTNWFEGTADIYMCPSSGQAVLLGSWQNLPPDTYYFPMIVHPDFEGDYVININATAKQHCAEDTIFGQSPSDVNENWTLYPSDMEVGYAAADRFESGNMPFNKITWWGTTINPEAGENCEPTEPYPFRIIFFDYDDNMPFLPGDTIGLYDVSVTSELTGFALSSYSQKKFTAVIPESLIVDTGWIMIIGNDGNGNNCTFAWQNSDLNGYGLYYDAVENRWSQTQSSLAFCLGDSSMVSIDDNPAEAPSAFELLQNYPNPFNATTSIRFSLPNTDDVSLTIFDIGGRSIKTLFNGTLASGTHQIIWDGTDQSGESVSSGIYFYTMKTSNDSFNNRMVLLK